MATVDGLRPRVDESVCLSGRSRDIESTGARSDAATGGQVAEMYKEWRMRCS